MSGDESDAAGDDPDLPFDVHPQSVLAVARKDFRDAVRSNGLLVLTATFVVFFGVAAYLNADSFQSQLQAQLERAANQSNVSVAQVREQLRGRFNSDLFLRQLTDVTRLFIPLTAIVVSYASVIGERESGSLKLLLSLPHSRLDVVLGKLAGRSATVAVPVLLGFAVAAPMFPIVGIPFKAVHFGMFALLTVAIGVLFVSLSVAVSTAVETSRRGVVGLMVVYALFTLMWEQLARALTLATRLLWTELGEALGSTVNLQPLGDQTLIQLQMILKFFSPIATYQALTTAIAGQQTRGLFARPPLRDAYAQQFGELPFYLTDGALVVWLVVWTVVPLAVGYLAFREADL